MFRSLRKGLRLLGVVSLVFPPFLWALEPFTVRDIRVLGLQRLSPGTVFNYLPVKVGERFDEMRSGEAVRALFKTGLFKDVRLEQEGDVLVVVVTEREAISQITISGNKDIKSEDLLEGLKQVGLAEGEVLDESLLDQAALELRRQYFALGKYAVDIKTEVEKLGGNRVAVSIAISEGRAAKIKQITIVGNTGFTDKKLLKGFKLTTPTLFSFFTKSDQYSRQKLGGDLETLRSLYLDSGHINFAIDSTQVSITPDKRDVYITINITEGDRYQVSDVKLAGNLVVGEKELFPLVETLEGQTFSRKAVTETSTNISERLGDEGYAFANVNAIPQIDKDSKQVAITYFVDPGKRVYVRRIQFTGNTKTRDEVMRREMRQMESAWIATSKVERSKTRLQRLGYFEDVNVETPAVPGTTDQVDVNFSVTERASGNLLLGVGFSQNQGIIFNTSITQDNFLGSGKRVNFAFNNSEVNRRFLVAYTNPYWTIDGVSRGFNLSYRETDFEEANVTRVDSRVASAGVSFGIPITEFQSLNLAADYERTDIEAAQFAAQEVLNFLATNGDQFDVLRLSSSFAYDTRNKALLPDRGVLHQVRAEVAIPGGNLQYYKLDYDARWLVPLIEDYTLSLKADVGYGDGYGDTSELPFFENFFAGGPRTVRGFEENTLGLRDSTGRAIGGNFKLIGNAELILPLPFLADVKSVRVTAFVDAGNVYGPDEDIDFGQLRYSTGLSGIWLSPFGVISVSVAAPLSKQDGDDTQPFQFTFGTSF
ncbi:MAG: outer membrane protein assembly factor BamA [Gammaproteobacteria bacterium]